MLNFRKRIFLFLTIIAMVLCLGACSESSNTVRITFDSDVYEVRMQSQLEVKPTIKAASSVDLKDVEVVYESLDESIVRYQHGVLYPVSEGEAEIKVYWKDKEVVFDRATVKVVKAALPVLVYNEGEQFLKGDEAKLTYNLHKNYTGATVVFESLTPEVATVSANGVVSAHAVGKADIHAVVSDNEESAEYTFSIEVIESDFAIKYVLDGGVNAESNPAGYSVLTLPLELAAPSKVGYDFAGWLLDGVKIDAIPVETYGDITLVATWAPTEYAVSYDLAGGEVAEGNPATYNVEQLPVALPVAPTKAHYEFAGWAINGEVVTEIAAGTVGDVSVVATWKPVEYAISYDLAGGEVAEGNPATYNVEQLPLAIPQVPTKVGYEFAGWKLGENVVNELPAETAGEVALVATWKAVQYSAVLDAAGGSFVGKYATREEMVADFLADYNAFAKAQLTDVSQYWGHAQKTNFWKNAEMYAKWSWIFEALIPFAKAQGQSTDYLNNMLLETPKISGYATQNVAIYLLGINNNIWNEQYKASVAGLSSKWTTVDCTSDEVKDSWKAYAGISVTYTVETEAELPTPEKVGYTFLGWYEGENKVEKIAVGTAKDVSLVAKWEVVKYSISYELDGGYIPGKYATREEMVADFIADYNAYKGLSHTAESFAALGSWSEISYASTFLYNEAYRAKWAWVVDYIATVASAANKHAWEVFNNFDAQSGLNGENSNNIYCIAYELRGFIGGIQYTKNANFKTADYSDPAINAGWEAYAGMGGIYTVEDEVVLPAAEKEGYLFLGWYDGETKVEKIEKGSTGDVVLTAKWEAEVYSAITYVLDGGVLPEGAANQYKEGVGLAQLPEPTKDGYKFLGWYVGENKVESISAESKGAVELTAQWMKLDVKHAITYELNGGVNAADAAAEYVEGIGYTLPVPTKDGYKFLGWTLAADSTEYVTAISETANAPVTVYAQWKEVVEGVAYVGAGLDYATLDEAVAGVEDGTKIILAAGEYTLSVVIAKSVEIVGPNAGVAGSAERAAEAVITVTANVAGNLNAKSIVFDGVSLVGATGANNAGVYFQNGGAPEYVAFKNCLVSEMNTFVKSTTGENAYELVLENNYITKVGQFILWTTKGTTKALVVGNYVDGGNCGTIYNTAAALFRVRCGKLEAYNNYFNGDSSNTPGYFESIAEESYVKYNTFNNVTRFAHPTAANKLVFDENLYLGSDGAVLSTVPAELSAVATVTVDATLATSEEDRAARYAAFAQPEPQPEIYAVTFDAAEGTFTSEFPTEYDAAEGIATLPTVERAGYKFLGWYLNGELIESVAAGTTGELTIVAKWEEIIVASEYSLTYDLAEGSWPSTAIGNHEEFANAFCADYSEYVGETVTPAKFMDISYLHGNLDDFFDNEKYNAKWGWVRTFVVEFCQKTANQYASNIADKNAEYHNTILRGNVHGFINCGKWDSWPKSADYSGVKFADYEAKLPAGEIVEGPAKYVAGVVTELVVPVREGYEFAGWICGSKVITEISADMAGDYTLVARWRVASGEEGVIYVGAEREYKSVNDALAVALPGDVIKVDAGNYAGFEVTVNGVTIQGPNAGVNPNTETRAEEAIFNEDVIVSANNVVIDGIQTTGASRVMGGANGASDVVIKNVWSKGSTLNPEASNSNIAPFYFSSTTAGVEYTNLTFFQVRMSDRQDGRPMAMYFDQVNNIVIKDSQFIGKRSNYNDAVKFGNEADSAYGVKGKVEIVGNHFENFAQYVLWFLDYQEGTYDIQNNTFLNCGQTSSSHNAARFASYSGADSGISEINFLYNTVNNSYMLIRLDAVASRTAETQPVKVNYNKLLNCGATYYIKNSNGYNIDGTNNYYDVAPSASLMLNVTWEPYYANEGDVPLYGQELSFYAIEYVTNGGQLAEGAPAMYDSKVGLAKLPEISKENHIFQGWLLNGQVVSEIAAGTTGKVVLEASFRENALYVSKNGEDYAYATIAEALAAAKDGNKIIILAGEWEEDVTVSVANLTIAGPNQGVDAVDGERAAEAIIKGVIKVDLAATNLTIDGLALTAGGRVVASATSGTYEGFTFKNNKVYDTNASETPWVVNRYKMDAVVEFRMASGGKCKNFEILNNSFVNCPSVNVMVNRPHNISVDGNVFKNFSQDAFRIAGGYTHGIHAFTNNVFEVEKQGDAHTGIFFYSLSGGDAFPRAIVQNNVFRNLGQADSSKFTGALAANFYQEMGLEWNISNNIFDHCYNYMWLRNNGADASNWSSKIENNQFLGLPQEYYYGTYTGSDTQTTNPHLNVFGANYYEDNEGNVITDMNTIADKFFHTATIGTALEAKPVYTAAEKYEFWTVTYELDGGTAKNLVYEYNKDTGAIALPTPTWNIYHEFAGWEFNGQIVTEIPAGTKGDIVVVAKWTEIEGNPVTLNFELNGGNWRYSSFADISADLLADYNNYGGTNYTASTLPTGAWVNINIHNFFYSEGMSEKWGWLAGWLGEVGGSANKPGCKALLTYSDASSFAAANGNYPYEVSYEFRAIMRGSSITSNSSYKTPDYSVPALNEQIWEPLVKAQVGTYETTEGKVLTLPQAHKQYLAFAGWYDNAELTGEPITEITVGATNPTYYAKYYDPNPVTDITVANAVTQMNRFTTHQLVWEVLPAAAANKGVNFVSTDEKVCTVNAEGLITAVAQGSCEIKLISAANDQIVTILPITVIVPTFMVGEFETVSYVKVNETISVSAVIKNGEGNIVWSSSDDAVATVVDGVVTGHKAGTVTITATSSNDANVKVEFFVTVIDGEVSEVLQFVLDQHNANIYTSYDLGIGAGTPAYYSDIYGSVSKILYNHELVINTDYLAKGNATKDYYENAHTDERYGGIQFVTFHYTAGMGATADTDNHASYFTGGTADVSIHYITGNKGTEGYEVYNTLSHEHGAWHAGDSNSRYYSNSTNVDEEGKKRFQWIPTGVAYDGSEILDIVWSASDDFYFEINGQKTTIKLPDTYNYNSRNTNHIYNADGTISSREDFTFSWAKFENRTPESFFNNQGFAATVIDGMYYMGPTWWSYGQVVEGRICAVGGNQNSIGIESCVNEGSDLWLTWQITGQLIAKLLYDNNLTIDRVKGHHFFDGKDCPQPLLENDLEIWYEIIECIKAELALIDDYKDYTFTMVSNNPEIVDNQGRVVNIPDFATAVSYTVTITKGDTVETITLGSVVPGIYEK